MDLNYQAGPTPLLARQNFPIVSFAIAGVIILAVLFTVYFVFKKYSDYLKSDKYKSALANRITKIQDVIHFSKLHNLDKDEKNLLWEVCKLTKCQNILFLLKDNNAVYDLFSNAFDLFKKGNALNDEELNNFFLLLYKIEMIVAQTKVVTSTKFLGVDTVVFFISENGEQYPLHVVKNTKDALYMDFPDHLVNTPRQPKLLVRQRFTFKTSNGLSYNLIARVIRFETTNDNKTLLVVAHSEDLSTQAQRHFKREFLREECEFSALKIKENRVDDERYYVYSDKAYKGILSNISAGGCCVQTKLPIKENQYLTIGLSNLGIDEKLVGIIKRTRRLPNGLFALHVQFKRISLKSKNQIYAMVYKFVL